MLVRSQRSVQAPRPAFFPRLTCFPPRASLATACLPVATAAKSSTGIDNGWYDHMIICALQKLRSQSQERLLRPRKNFAAKATKDIASRKTCIIYKTVLILVRSSALESLMLVPGSVYFRL